MNHLLVQPAPAVSPGQQRFGPDTGSEGGGRSADAFDDLLTTALARNEAPSERPPVADRDDRSSSRSDDRSGADKTEATGREERTERREDSDAADEVDEPEATDESEAAESDATDEADGEAEAAESSSETEGDDGDAETEGQMVAPTQVLTDPLAGAAVAAVTLATLPDGTEAPSEVATDETASVETLTVATTESTGEVEGTETTTTPAVTFAGPETSSDEASAETAQTGPRTITLDESPTAGEGRTGDGDDTDAEPDAAAPEIELETAESVTEAEDAQADPTLEQVDDGDHPRSALADTEVTTAPSDETADRSVVAPRASSAEAVAGASNDGPRPVSALAEPASASTTTEAAASLSSSDVDGTTDNPLFRQVQRALSNIRLNARGEQTFTIRLHPEELGSVTVKVTATENGMRIGLVADSVAAAGQLSNQRQQLEQELSDGGLADASVDVSHGGASDGDGDATGEEGGSGSGSSASTGTTAAGTAERRSFRPRPATTSTIDLDL